MTIEDIREIGATGLATLSAVDLGRTIQADVDAILAAPAKLQRPDTQGLLRKMEPRPIGLKPEWAFDNPFASVMSGAWVIIVPACDRIDAVREFTAEQCRQVLELPDVQKSVRQAAEVRLRKLAREAAAMTGHASVHR